MRIVVMLVALALATPAQAEVFGESMGCYTFTKANVKRLTGIKRRAAYACVNGVTGEVLGAVMTGSGLQVCEIRGWLDSFDDLCANVTVCGQPHTFCF